MHYSLTLTTVAKPQIDTSGAKDKAETRALMAVETFITNSILLCIT